MRSLPLCLAILLAGCTRERKPAAPATPTAPAETLTLKELQNGDAACYVLVTSASGQELNYHGDFELCPGAGRDASALIGQAVKLTLGKQKVMAGSCEGNPECTETEEVDFVSAVAAAP